MPAGSFPVKCAAALALALCVAGCATVPPTNIHQPMTARPAVPAKAPAASGAIFAAGINDRPLFEDIRARRVGDTLIVSINEVTNASKKSSSTAKRTESSSMAIPTIAGLPGKGLQGASLSANGADSFEGKGDSASNNAFTGTITVTVIEVLPNGNLVVSGEKQLGINQGSEFVRLSGVVNPATIGANNSVTSTQIADARIEYRGNGYVDEAQVMGWLARFFLLLKPF